jgi:hypothetical protein
MSGHEAFRKEFAHIVTCLSLPSIAPMEAAQWIDSRLLC